MATVRRLVRQASAQAPLVLQRLQEWWGELAVAGGRLPVPPGSLGSEPDPLEACLTFAHVFRQGLMQAQLLPAEAGLLDMVTFLLQGDPAWL